MPARVFHFRQPRWFGARSPNCARGKWVLILGWKKSILILINMKDKKIKKRIEDPILIGVEEDDEERSPGTDLVTALLRAALRRIEEQTALRFERV